MEIVKFDIEAEVRKFLTDKPTKVSPEVLLNTVGYHYLEDLNDQRAERGERPQKLPALIR